MCSSQLLFDLVWVATLHVGVRHGLMARAGRPEASFIGHLAGHPAKGDDRFMAQARSMLRIGHSIGPLVEPAGFDEVGCAGCIGNDTWDYERRARGHVDTPGVDVSDV